MTLLDLIPTQIAHDIKVLCDYTCEGEYSSYEESLEIHDEDENAHIYQTSVRIRNSINKEVPF